MLHFSPAFSLSFSLIVFHLEIVLSQGKGARAEFGSVISCEIRREERESCTPLFPSTDSFRSASYLRPIYPPSQPRSEGKAQANVL